MVKVASPSTEIVWDPAERIATVRYVVGTVLSGQDGDFLVESMLGWIGTSDAPFAVCADATGLGGTDAAYRARTSAFFRQRRETAFIALLNVGPAVRVVAEMFRVGTGVQVKAFVDQTAARAWLRAKGLAL